MSLGGGFGQQPTPMGGGQSPLSTGGGMSGGFGGFGGFGGAQSQPMQNPFQPQQQPPAPEQMAQPVPLQNPFQPQQSALDQDQEYQGYQTQARDLSRQMDEYMKKAPMYQQMQDLQSKMAPFQQRQEMQRMQQMQQRQFNPYQQQQQPFNPYARQMPQQQMPFNKGMPYRQPAYDPMGEGDYYNRMAQPRQQFSPYGRQVPQQSGLQGLASLMAGYPSQDFGRQQQYANSYGDMSQRLRPAAAPVPAPAAVEASPAVFDPGYQVASW